MHDLSQATPTRRRSKMIGHRQGRLAGDRAVGVEAKNRKGERPPEGPSRWVPVTKTD
jgi:hypothetical protein